MPYAFPYFCHDCHVKFTIYWTPEKRPCCPKCEDSIAVRKNPYNDSGRNPITVGTKPYWTDDEIERCMYLLETKKLTHREIGKELGRSVRAVNVRICRIRKERLWDHGKNNDRDES
jgi:hypothetical protein